MARFVVVTPVLNGAGYLDANLASIKAQTDPDWVHYLVDGGSTDGSLEILAQAVADDPRRHLVTGNDRGICDAVAKGFEMAFSDGLAEPSTICVWLGSDDLIMPWAFATLRGHFDATGAEWVTALPALWDFAGRLVAVQPANWYPRRWIRAGWFNNRTLGSIQSESTFFTYRLLSKLCDEATETFRASKLAGDFMLWREFARHAPLVPITSTVAGFRKHGANLSTIREAAYFDEIRSYGVSVPPAWLGRLFRMLYRPIASMATALAFRRTCQNFEAGNAQIGRIMSPDSEPTPPNDPGPI